LTPFKWFENLTNWTEKLKLDGRMNLNPFLKWYGTTFGKRVWKIIFAVKMTQKSDDIVLLNPFDFRGARNLDCGRGLCLVTREITKIVRYHSTANPNL